MIEMLQLLGMYNASLTALEIVEAVKKMWLHCELKFESASVIVECKECPAMNPKTAAICRAVECLSVAPAEQREVQRVWSPRLHRSYA